MKTNFENVELEANFVNYEIHFDYQPLEPQTSLDPGCRASVEIYWLCAVDGVEAEELGIEFQELPESTQILLEQLALEYAQNY